MVKLRLAGSNTATVRLAARLRGRILSRTAVNIPGESGQTAVLPLGFKERRRLRRARSGQLAVEAVATDPTGRRAKARATGPR